MTVPEKHQIRIAKQVIREPEAMTLVMGGMTKKEAAEILQRFGYQKWLNLQHAYESHLAIEAQKAGAQ